MALEKNLELEVKKKFNEAFSKGEIKTETKDSGRVYIINDITIPLTNTSEVLETYYNLVLNKTSNASVEFNKLNRCTIYVGQPDTGKTYKAINESKDIVGESNVILLICHNEMSLNNILETFTLIDGKPAYIPTYAFNCITDKQNGKYIIVLDEANTGSPSFLKSLQPLLDTTSTSFVFKDGTGKEVICHKNPNCKFILTMNDKDKGINILPDAILSRSLIKYFTPVSVDTLSKWTGVSTQWITKLKQIYDTLKISNVFGSRQINALYGKGVNDISIHLKGLTALKGMSSSIIETTEITRLINILCSNLDK